LSATTNKHLSDLFPKWGAYIDFNQLESECWEECS
jgi:hypothetical protein